MNNASLADGPLTVADKNSQIAEWVLQAQAGNETAATAIAGTIANSDLYEGR